MQIPLVSTCCCFCSLKTGTKIIGWLSLIFTITLVILTTIELAGYNIYEDGNLTPDSEAEILLDVSANKAIAVFWITFGIAEFVITILLLVGVYKNKAQLVIFYVVIDLTLVLMGIVSCLLIALVFSHPSVLFELILCGLDFYCLLVVYSFHRELCSTSDQV